ncbi:hypothetical protein D9M72_463740 [compost metagenome]
MSASDSVVLPARRLLPGVAGLINDGAEGEGTWSKLPSFSSKLTMSTVLLHTSGEAVSASSTSCVYQAPSAGLDGPGCSEYWAGATIHDTFGSVLLRMCCLKVSRKPPSGMVLEMPL